MSNYYSQNLHVLKSIYPNIYQFAKLKKPNLAKYRIESARNGQSNIIVMEENGSNYSIHSKYNPSNEAELWVQSIAEKVGDSQNILVFGFGLGYHIEKLIAKYPNKTLYIYEPNEDLFSVVLKARNMTKILSHSKIGIFAVGSEEWIRYELVHNIAYQVKDSFSFVALPTYNRIYGNIVSELSENTETLILNYRSNLATVLHFQHEWIDNILTNLEKVVTTPSLKGLKGTCKDIPAIIVGSGPSLQEDIEWLRKMKSNSLIIAAGSSIQALLHEGIIPDCIVSIDGGEPNYRVFKDLDVSSIPFVFGTTIKHTILEKYEGNLIHLLLDLDLISLHLLESQENEPIFQTNSTVTGICIQLAYFLQCPRIILTGQDLSYPNNQYYTKGVQHIDSNHMSQIVESATEKVPNVWGGENKTTKKMLNTLRDIEHLLALIPETEFINTSRNGAEIKGTIFKDMADVFAENENRNLNENWFNELITTSIKPYSLEDQQKIFRKIKSAKTEIRKIENKLKILSTNLKELSKAVQNLQQEIIEKKLFEIDILWKWISGRKTFEHIYFFPLQAHVSVFMRQLPDIASEKNPRLKGEAIVTHLGALVVEMIRITPELLKGIDIAINRISKRLMSSEVKGISK